MLFSDSDDYLQNDVLGLNNQVSFVSHSSSVTSSSSAISQQEQQIEQVFLRSSLQMESFFFIVMIFLSRRGALITAPKGNSIAGFISHTRSKCMIYSRFNVSSGKVYY